MDDADMPMPIGLRWQDYLHEKHYGIPLHALRRSAVTRLALHLNLEMEMSNETGLQPDFGGLAELVGFDSLEITGFERAQNPTKSLFEEWKNRPEFKPTVGRLVKFLAYLGREDILTDCQEMINKEIQAFEDRPKKFAEQAPIQDETVSQGPGYEEVPRFITRHDVIKSQEVKYDAFVCYNPVGEDLAFVQELIRRFEAPPYNFTLFVPCRDDLAGLNAHTISAKIISERCRHMIVVLSPNFLESKHCEFQSTFAHALSPGARNKRIVPIRIEDCPMPNILRIMACCDFTKKDLRDWSWDRLARSIMIPLSVEDFVLESSSSDASISTDAISASDLSLFRGDSGYFNSSSDSRSSSPAPRPQRSMTAPIPCPPGPSSMAQSMESPMQTESPQFLNHTAPIASASKKPSPSGLKKFSGMFSSKKSKKQVADSQC